MEAFGMLDPQRYLWGPLIMDFASGIASLVPILIAGLALGGFSFWQPWLIAIPLVMLLMGWLRGRNFGNLWVKALVLNAPMLLLFVWIERAETAGGYVRAVLILIGVTVLPAAGGIKIRRRQMCVPEAPE